MFGEVIAFIKNETNNYHLHIKSVIVIFVSTISLIMPRYCYFNSSNKNFYYSFLFRIAIPVVIIAFLFKDSLVDYGVGLGNVRVGLIISILFLFLYIPIFLMLVKMDPFSKFYKRKHTNARGLIGNELKLIVGLFETEFLFRGFLLFGLRDVLGDGYAILIHVIPYSIMHIGKPMVECIGSIPVGVALGYLSLRAGSIWYGFILHWTIARVFDFAINTRRRVAQVNRKPNRVYSPKFGLGKIAE